MFDFADQAPVCHLRVVYRLKVAVDGAEGNPVLFKALFPLRKCAQSDRFCNESVESFAIRPPAGHGAIVGVGVPVCSFERDAKWLPLDVVKNRDHDVSVIGRQVRIG